ncbi:MAG: peptidyl-tRNA hydrolase [Chloroflexi bacterium]|nr:peptidyl-tRNA hydrolase [Chloroflexota bacterium]
MNEPANTNVQIKLIVGLGNPGRRYVHTRHNIGFMVLDDLHKRLKGSPWREDRLAATATVVVDGQEIVLVKPLTFMNLSGQAVKSIAARLRISPASILVVSDDLDLPFGRQRLRPDGSTGGHNGLRSIAAELGTGEYPRLRIGIGRPVQGDPIEWVLAPFDAGEAADLALVCDFACRIIQTAIETGVRIAMNEFNGRGDIRVPAVAPKPVAVANAPAGVRGKEVDNG